MITGIVRQRAGVRLLQIEQHVNQIVDRSGHQVTNNTVVFLTDDLNVFQGLWFDILTKTFH
jgi:hypothetical protein